MFYNLIKRKHQEHQLQNYACINEREMLDLQWILYPLKVR